MSSTSPSHRISIYFSYILRPPPEGRARHSQECFFPSRGGFNLRCTRERDIPKNVFFLREEVLIYDATSLPRKDNRFDQELLREEVLIYDQFYRCPATMGNDWGSSCHGYTDRGRVERGIERELYFTEPPDFHIFPRYPPL